MSLGDIQYYKRTLKAAEERNATLVAALRIAEVALRTDKKSTPSYEALMIVREALTNETS